MTQQNHISIHPQTHLGLVSLTVADLGRSLDFYTELLGFTVLEQQDGYAALGPAAGPPILVLHEQPGAPPKPREAAGLYHVAILYPSRPDLGRAVQRLTDFNYPIREFEDHLVSESAYLADPDGNGLELYRDRPPDQWPRTEEGRPTMGSEPIDVPALLAEGAAGGQLWHGLPAGTRIGHLHLQVADIPQAETFYCGRLGFDLIFNLQTALFVSAGGYHHHIGMNIWFSQDGPLAPADTAGMRLATLHFADEAARAAVVDRLLQAAVPIMSHPGGLLIADPWQNKLLLVVGDAAPPAEVL
jgi:catechol 2,3-dioxygenase